jgi:hypothetical protein
MRTAPVMPGVSYLRLAKGEANLEEMRRDLGGKRPVLLLTARDPLDLSSRDGWDGVVWVTGHGTSRTVPVVRPRDPSPLLDHAKGFLAGGEGIVLVDCLHELVLRQGFPRALRWLQRLTDHAAVRRGSVVVLADKTRLSERQRSLLERELDILPPFDDALKLLERAETRG